MEEAVFIVPTAFIIATAFVLTPIARAYAKRMEHRSATRLPDEASQRLERMEQAIDAIAVEVERISEGQRFTTKLLSDQRAQAGIAPGPRA